MYNFKVLLRFILLVVQFVSILLFSCLECSKGMFGPSCKETCRCKNGATCDHVSGGCLCGPGWRGIYCDKSCPDGFYGMDCQLTCSCDEGTNCNPVSGECNCPLGWDGEGCSRPCPQGHWGKDCQQVRSWVTRGQNQELFRRFIHFKWVLSGIIMLGLNIYHLFGGLALIWTAEICSNFI